MNWSEGGLAFRGSFSISLLNCPSRGIHVNGIIVFMFGADFYARDDRVQFTD